MVLALDEVSIWLQHAIFFLNVFWFDRSQNMVSKSKATAKTGGYRKRCLQKQRKAVETQHVTANGVKLSIPKEV